MNCPLCGGTECQNKFESQSNALKYHCKEYDKEFLVSGNVEQPQNNIKQNQLNNLVFEFIIRNAVCGDDNKSWWFQYLPERKYYHGLKVLSKKVVIVPNIEVGQNIMIKRSMIGYIYGV